MRVLLIQLEFPIWKAAKSWGYSGHFGLEEGFHAHQIETFIIPAWGLVQANSHLSWLHYAKELCKNKNFDQVWLWLVHCEYRQEFLDWVKTLAPIRVGCLYESLSYTSEECIQNPKLETRRADVCQQMQGLTHIICSDECDASYIQEQGIAQAIWSPTFVPRRFVSEEYVSPLNLRPAFWGALYSEERRQWLQKSNLINLLARPASPEDATGYPLQFDRLQQATLNHFQQGLPVDEEVLRQYVDDLRKIRQGAFASWMKGLREWNGIVNFPSFGKVYTSRVAESMAAGSPAISWEVPNRPRNKALFEDGKEILLYQRDQPEQLIQHILNLQNTPKLAKSLVDHAREKIKRFHTAEVRIGQILHWIQTGKEPMYGEGSLAQLVSQPDNTPVICEEESRKRAKPHTTVFIITVGDSTLAACQEAIRHQITQSFVLDLIRNVHPMSAAFQEMIKRCETEYFIQVDEDMILEPTAVSSMEGMMRKAPDDIGMICFHLYDIDRNANIQGVKIYRTAAIKSLAFRDVKACEMDLLEQMGQRGIRWILHPSVQGRHGTAYSPETIYRRYKSMYEKDILEWNDVTEDICHKATQFRETGDLLSLFALMGAVDGIVSVPYAKDQEKDFTKYDLKALEIFRQIFLESPVFPLPYEKGRGMKRKCLNPPIPLEQVQWKSLEQPHSMEFPENHSCQSKRSLASLDRSKIHKKRILLACQFFWPSVGGVETVVANLGRELVKQGYQVDVATVAMPNRSRSEYQGMHIISLDAARKIGPRKIPYLCWELHQLLNSGVYGSCVLFANPHNWLITSLLIGDIAPQTNLFIQLLVNNEGFEEWRNDQLFCDRLAMILHKITGALSLTQAGIEAEFMRRVGITPIFLPNATTPILPSIDFRETYDIDKETFLVLHVANIWKVKNHLGLLDSFTTIPPNWKLVLIGLPYDKDGPQEMEYSLKVMKALQYRSDILYIPGLPHEDVAAAMKTANVVVLASHAEISPMAIVEAMSYGIPWLATPECGDVAEKAGGIVAPLDLFPAILTLLEQQPELALALGKVGFAHWQASFNWDVVREGWIELVDQGSLSKTYEMPPTIAQRMDDLQSPTQ